MADPTFDDLIPAPQAGAPQNDEPSFDDLIPSPQAGAPQYGEPSFDDLIPSPRAGVPQYGEPSFDDLIPPLQAGVAQYGEPSFDDLIPALQAGAPQYGERSFDDLIPAPQAGVPQYGEPSFDDLIPALPAGAPQYGEPSFDDLIPSPQAGAPQYREPSFNDLIPNLGAPWQPLTSHAGAVQFGDANGNAKAARAVRDSQPQPMTLKVLGPDGVWHAVSNLADAVNAGFSHPADSGAISSNNVQVMFPSLRANSDGSTKTVYLPGAKVTPLPTVTTDENGNPLGLAGISTPVSASYWRMKAYRAPNGDVMLALGDKPGNGQALFDDNDAYVPDSFTAFDQSAFVNPTPRTLRLFQNSTIVVNASRSSPVAPESQIKLITTPVGSNMSTHLPEFNPDGQVSSPAPNDGVLGGIHNALAVASFVPELGSFAAGLDAALSAGQAVYDFAGGNTSKAWGELGAAGMSAAAAGIGLIVGDAGATRAVEEATADAVKAAGAAAPLDVKVALQGVTDRAVAELNANPDLARDLMSRGSYQHLVERTNLAPASYGKAVERLTARLVADDPELSQVLTHQARPFVSTPDFFGYEGYNLRPLEITTDGEILKHGQRPYGPSTQYVTYPGLPPELDFPQ